MSEDEDATERTTLLRSTKRTPPVYLKFRSSKVLICFAVACAVFTDAFLYSVIVPVFPFSLRERAHVNAEDVQWWQSLMLAMFGGTMLAASPILGYYADQSPSRRAPFLLGLAMNTLSIILLGTATSAWLLAASRALQGIASSIVWSAGLAMICDTIRADEVGKWMGWVVSSASFALIMAPALGGLVYARAGYQAVFYMCSALLAVDILLRLIIVEKKTAEAYLGGTSFGSAQPSYQECQGSHAEEPSIRKGRRVPLIFRLVIDPRFAAAFYGFACFAIILAGFDGVLGLYVNKVYHWNPVRTGAIYLTLGIPGLAGPLVGALGNRAGAKWIASLGLGFTCMFLMLLALGTEPFGDHPLFLIMVLTAIGISLVFVATPMAAEMSAVVDRLQADEGPGSTPGYAQAFALLNCANAVGCLIGPILNGAVIERFGWRVMNIVLAILVACGILPAILFTGGSVFQPKSSP